MNKNARKTTKLPTVVDKEEDADPLVGRIVEVTPPSDSLELGAPWSRLYSVLWAYGRGWPDGRNEYIRCETLNILYSTIYRDPMLKSEDFMGVSLADFCLGAARRWVACEFDEAGFLWVHLRQEPLGAAQVSRAVRLLDSSNGRDLARKFAKHDEDVFTPDLPDRPAAVPPDVYISDDTRSNIYGLVVQKFSLGLDSMQLYSTYNARYGHYPEIVPKIGTINLFQNYLCDVLRFVQKSPVHGHVFARLDIAVHIPDYVLRESCLEAEYGAAQTRRLARAAPPLRSLDLVE